ncbi:MAG TPA: MFS transporter [Clostridiales bacterium]|nr:MFS transporter [Clostridiales bacterium]
MKSNGKSQSNKFQKATTSEIIRYSFGGLGSNIPFILMMTYLNYFYTDVMGISALVVSGVMLVTRIFDAVTDPLMGILGDRTRTRLGRYRPWIIIGAPLLGLFTFLVFYAPELSESAKIIYVYVTYILYSTFSDFANIPYHSLTPVISQDPNQRNVIVSLKQGMGIIAQLVITSFGLNIVEACGGGRIGWAWFGAMCGIIIAISFYICASSAKRYDNLSTLPEVTKETKVKISDQLKIIFKNRPLISLLVSFFCILLGGAVSAAVNVYYFKYILNRMDLVMITSFISIIASVVVIFIMPPLAKRFGKKLIYIICDLISVLSLIVLWFQPNATATVLCVALGWTSFFSRFPSNLGWSMLPECVDYSEWKYGLRGNSTITASLTFTNKLGTALGGFLASFIMGLAGFIANVEPTAAVKDTIVFLRFGLPTILTVISALAIIFYNIDNKMIQQIRSELNERSAADNAAAASE